MKNYLRWVVKAVLASLLFGFWQVAGAQDFPARPIRLLIGYPPGGVPDTIGRAVAPSMSATLGQPFLVENRPGAGGLTAVQELMRSEPDGHTLMSGDSGQWAILPAMRPGVYDPEKAFAPVGQVSTNAIYITVRSTLGVKTIQEFIALMKSKPGVYNYGSSGNGTVHHLFMASFMSEAGLDLRHIPYKGAVQQTQALVAGDIPIGVVSMTNSTQFVKTGQLVWLLASTRTRSKLTPEVPSTAEAGFPDIHFAGDVGYVAPAGTPRAVIERISAALAKAVQQPELLQRSQTMGVEPTYRNPDQLAELMRADRVTYNKAVKISGAKVE